MRFTDEDLRYGTPRRLLHHLRATFRIQIDANFFDLVDTTGATTARHEHNTGKPPSNTSARAALHSFLCTFLERQPGGPPRGDPAFQVMQLGEALLLELPASIP